MRTNHPLGTLDERIERDEAALAALLNLGDRNDLDPMSAGIVALIEDELPAMYAERDREASK